VGIYVGGGQMIEAEHTGTVVHYASIYRYGLLPVAGRPSLAQNERAPAGQTRMVAPGGGY